jgi:formate-dependent nitrite reductase membrane component NrfD
MTYLAAEHFVRAPGWEWYILGYFFLAGLTGGCYALATLLRQVGGARTTALWRLGYLAAFPALLLCPILLTIDLGQPIRFWHMMINTTPGGVGLNFKYSSPMSLGVWALLLYGIFPTVSFLEMLVLDGVIDHPLARRLAGLLGGTFGRGFELVGAVLGLFIASYTGVLLTVSNQPIWSDTWALSGLFLASGLSGSAALLALLARYRKEAEAGESWLRTVEGYFALIELLLAAAFLATLVPAGMLSRALGFPWLLLWLLVLVSLLLPLRGLIASRPVAGGGHGTLALGAASATAVVPILVLLGVLALRLTVIFSAQL